MLQMDLEMLCLQSQFISGMLSNLHCCFFIPKGTDLAIRGVAEQLSFRVFHGT